MTPGQENDLQIEIEALEKQKSVIYFDFKKFIYF
jgi:hypothetical protein